MSRAVLVDTGPLYAANDLGDGHHERAVRELQHLARSKHEVLVCYPTLLEAYTLILYRLGRPAAIEWLGEMAEASLLNPTLEDYGHGMNMVRRFADQQITLVDATVAALAFRLGVEVWTYDHHFDVMRVRVWRL
jgi:predicted nucleic acid-binding protein